MKELLCVCLTRRSITDALMQVKAELMKDTGNQLLLVSALSSMGSDAYFPVKPVTKCFIL